jgi:hypothetical protein
MAHIAGKCSDDHPQLEEMVTKTLANASAYRLVGKD